MNWKITLIQEAYTSRDGTYHETTKEEMEIPYEMYQEVWFCYKKRKKWVIEKNCVASVWATNTYGVELTDGRYVSCKNFNRLFADRDKAIEYCLSQNQKATVKIYGE